MEDIAKGSASLTRTIETQPMTTPPHIHLLSTPVAAAQQATSSHHSQAVRSIQGITSLQLTEGLKFKWSGDVSFYIKTLPLVSFTAQLTALQFSFCRMCLHSFGCTDILLIEFLVSKLFGGVFVGGRLSWLREENLHLCLTNCSYFSPLYISFLSAVWIVLLG